MIYKDWKRNHVTLPGREDALKAFLQQEYKGMQHKWKNACNSNSEDALTWSCFDFLSSLPFTTKITAIREILEDAYEGKCTLQLDPHQTPEHELRVNVGKQYTGRYSKETTEVDASIELPGKLVFFEAKLYGVVSMASPPENAHDQIARKLRIGLDSPLGDTRDFYFIFLDVAPPDKLTLRRKKADALSPSKNRFHDKWKNAWLFEYYKYGRNNCLRPLREALEGINAPSTQSIADNMGWLTWADLFNSVLRGAISA